MMGGYTLGEGSSFWMPLFEMSFLMTTVSAKIGRKLSQVGVQNILNGKGGGAIHPKIFHEGTKHGGYQIPMISGAVELSTGQAVSVHQVPE